jgi:DNA-binding beta-propeller fold protein YncE
MMNSNVKRSVVMLKAVILIAIICVSCEKENVSIERYNFGDSTGVFILNEGNYTQENSSLSFLNLESMKLYNNLFFKANDTKLGDVAYSMTIYNDKAYIAVNNSGRIYVIDINNGRFEGKITGLSSPRYIHILNDTKGYVSDLYLTKITVINPSEYQVIGTIDVSAGSDFNQHSTEQMALYGDWLFIGCWSYDNKILVLDVTTDSIVDSITVAKQPNSLLLDKNKKLWVLSDGGYPGSSYGQEYAALTKINAETRETELVMRFPSLDDSPVEMVSNGSGDTLYFVLRGIRRMSIADTELPEKAFIEKRNNDYYSIAVDPMTSVIYAGDPLDYMQNGLLYRFTPDGELIDSMRVGINPGAFCFKN